MTEGEREALALEADRILTDETIRNAIATMRMAALEQLADIQPEDTAAIHAAQANVRAADAFVTTLRGFILQGTPRKGPTVA